MKRIGKRDISDGFVGVMMMLEIGYIEFIWKATPDAESNK